MKNKINDLKNILWFLVKLNILSIPLYIVIYFNFSIPIIQDFWAIFLKNSLSFLGYITEVESNIIAVNFENKIYEINFSWDSTGWKSFYIMISLVISSGIGTIKYKLKFLAIALPTIILINIIRVISTVILSLNFGFDNFDFIHTFLWSSLMIILIIIIWYLFFVKLNKYKNNNM